MASEVPHQQEFRVRELTTRSVLLFPTRAQIIRDIKEIALHPGANKIIIDGLAPTVDEHSIKVEGTGSATITDVAVDLLPNREVYEDIYPEDDEDEDDESEDESEDEAEGMKALNGKIEKFQVELLKEQEKINSGNKRLVICDQLGNSLNSSRPTPPEFEDLLKAYKTEREKIFHEHEIATAAVSEKQREIAKIEKEKIKLAKELVKASEKARKQKMKEKEKKLRKKAEILKEKQRIKAQRESFWPKKVYRVTINLEPSSFTPSSSRRSSLDGDTVVNLATTTFHEPSSIPPKTGEISLSLSYITYSAFWSPRYDLTLSTLKNNGLLEYGAEICNTTSETWTNAKVILSTSQTTFAGLTETIPDLLPWHVRLAKGIHNDSALFSTNELQARKKEWSTSNNEAKKKPREENFGLDTSANTTVETALPYARRSSTRAAMAQNLAYRSQSNSGPVFGAFNPSSSVSGTLFGGTASAPSRGPGGQQRQLAPVGRAGRMAFRKSSGEPQFEEDEEVNDEEVDADLSGLFDEGAPAPAPYSLTFEEGAWEESGMTTTYDVPGFKTLAPSNSTVKHKIAKIDFKNVIFSHIIIGKLRQVAFLKARLRNASKITLLKGPLGLTLDGSFLGQASLPRCSAGESISIPLGVDPSITVHYPKPTVRRSQTGIFSKEGSNVFTRMVTVTNTKHNVPVELTVLDQVPVSEDERLKIEVLTPKGLRLEGESVKSGLGVGIVADESGKGTAKDVRASVYGTDGKIVDGKGGVSKWGSAVATSKKGGQVSWNVKLNPGQGVKLILEYEATFPAGESIIGV